MIVELKLNRVRNFVERGEGMEIGERVCKRCRTDLRQWRSVTMTTAPIPADTKDTITRVSTHPSSPGASAKKEGKSERLEPVRFSLAPSNRKDPPSFSLAVAAERKRRRCKKDWFVQFAVSPRRVVFSSMIMMMTMMTTLFHRRQKLFEAAIFRIRFRF